jgi:hypothetical protein
MLSTKNLPQGGSGLPKTIVPGEHVVKINSITLTRYPFMEQDNGYYLVMNVEGEPIDGFEGFLIDPENPDKGRYAGQIGEVKVSKFYFKDGTTKTGRAVNRDEDILKQIKNICTVTYADKWFEDADGKFATIEEFVFGFNTQAPFKDKKIRMCIAGKEYENKQGYPAWGLHLAKGNASGYNMQAADSKVSKLIKFNEVEHMERMSPAEVKNFGAPQDTFGSSDTPFLPDSSQFVL